MIWLTTGLCTKSYKIYEDNTVVVFLFLVKKIFQNFCVKWTKTNENWHKNWKVLFQIDLRNSCLSQFSHLTTLCSLSILIYDSGAEEKREEAETQASELLIKKHSLDELLVEIGSKGPRSAAKTREQVMMIFKFETNLNFIISKIMYCLTLKRGYPYSFQYKGNWMAEKTWRHSIERIAFKKKCR